MPDTEGFNEGWMLGSSLGLMDGVALGKELSEGFVDGSELGELLGLNDGDCVTDGLSGG
eukprot:CAMPEP_0201670582 /NCGR_PEP_ID=MMETSP0494-20130426/27201_1 /ASSEMBLY_ACC=CAM_ASM_000839 /TAXON_ID=420259 /ORGANISM="Thalassiosira gravida, Strain GMp14c1" /LENGTH=58 /DNA_ID=CAMNT_0048151677 /DNA_START=83 /DNA_END=259 /DNA_ORIENTATION=+